MHFLPSSRLLCFLALTFIATISQAHQATKGSALLSQAILASGEAREKLLEQFGIQGLQEDALLIELWRRGEIWTTKDPSGSSDVVVYNGKTGSGKAKGVRLSTAEPMTFDLATAAASNPDRSSRKQLGKLLDVLALKNPGERERAEAARQLGSRQEEDSRKILVEMLPRETSPVARKGFEEGIALASLKLGTGIERLNAIEKLGQLASLMGRDQLKALVKTESAKPDATRDNALIKIANASLRSIDDKQNWVERIGTVFRGLSTGSVLIVAALAACRTYQAG